MNWTICEPGFREEQISKLGSRLLCGNGYLGIRGTLEEYQKAQMPAVNLAGIYDQVGDGWREPLNAPNPVYTYLIVDGERTALPEARTAEHIAELDFRHGIFHRKTIFQTRRGQVTVESSRFADRSNVHRILLRYVVTADFHAEIELVTGIDGDVWDIHGPHYDLLESSEKDGICRMTAITHEKHDRVTVLEAAEAKFTCELHPVCEAGEKDGDGIHPENEKAEETAAENFAEGAVKKHLRRYSFVTEPGKEYILEKFAVVCTSQDEGWGEEQAEKLLRESLSEGFSKILNDHVQKWELTWENSQVEIDGDDEAMRALNYSIYHLVSIAPAHARSMSIPARGLSGQTYKGAVFWDTEMFMLDFFLFTDPDVAKTLMRYRIDTLPGALEKAASYGLEGAFYAWESQEGGYDACTDYNVTDVFTGRPQRTYFRDKQYHISAAVVYGILRYIELTGDKSLLWEGGLETIVECARFYHSLLYTRVSGGYKTGLSDKEKEKSIRAGAVFSGSGMKADYEIRDVIGPDEYHERVNNNAYTNRMAKLTLEAAAELLEELENDPEEVQEKTRNFYDTDELIRSFREDADRLRLQKPDENGVIPQFDGYQKLEDTTLEAVRSRLLHEKEYWGGAYGVATETKIIKQADVVTMLHLFRKEYSQEILKANWEYYEPRTEHGSSLSSCMYALVACECGMPQKAYPFFLKSARADLSEGGKEWAGLVYIGGTHPAAAGGAYMTAVEGFGGADVENGKLTFHAALPEHIREMRFPICFKGNRFKVRIDHGGTELTEA